MLAKKLKTIQPFHVMDILAKAQEMQKQGRDVIHLEVGEPDFVTPIPITQAAIKAIQKSQLFYTPSLGIKDLREAIAHFYKQYYQVEISYKNIAITSGASSALLMVLASLLDPDDELILADPGYPCNANFTYLLNAKINRINVDKESQFQLTLDKVKLNWSDKTKAVLIASPSNPTGTLIDKSELAKIIDFVSSKNATVIVDEIYQGLVYEQKSETALAINTDASNHVVIINSFSKYFQMTGWRLGWCIIPNYLVGAIDKLAQNIYLSPPTISQYAALSAFSKDSLDILEQRRLVFQQRRDYLYQALIDLGFKVYNKPQGAFYIYADCTAYSQDSMKFCLDILEQTGVAITPGKDFGQNNPQNYIRFAYTRDMSQLKEAIFRIKQFITKLK